MPDSEAYESILSAFLQGASEEALYRVSLLSQGFIESGLGPEDIIALHFDALDRLVEDYSQRDQLRANVDAQQFLLEVMIAYGVRFKEYLELKLLETQRDAELQAARDRERALDAERVGRQKTELLGVIAHELRTPLAAAQGNIDYARRLLSQGEVDRLVGFLESAREAMDRLSRLSADLVEASRDEPPRLELVSCNLEQILAQACVWAQASIQGSGVSLDFPIAGAGLAVRGDSDGLLSVFGNLLSNAIRYTPAGGRVAVRYGQSEAWVWTEVQDSGIGMSPEVQDRIFDKFYRAPEARQVESKGLGLGLALVRQMVQAHGGRIEVTSAPGQGSTFRVVLPLGTRQTAEPGEDKEGADA